MRKTRVLVLAGGQSGEHEVSIHSARSVLQALPRDRFDVTSIVISREGRWLPAADSLQALEHGSAASGGDLVLHQAQAAEGFDVVFPILHGPNGEDGTVQGMLKLARIPCVGSSVLGSAVCMDKVMAKAVLASHGIPQVAYRLVTRAEFASGPEAVLGRLATLGFPVFVKPANLGSSVGISKARNEPETLEALRVAFELDRRVIVEAATPGKPREIEVGILGNDDPRASPVGELTFDSEFYDYATKYTAGKAAMHIPASVPPAIASHAQALAIQAFSALDCAGLARVDFFYLDSTGELFLNEVNTMPGFTRTSMYPELWRAAGVGYAELVSRLIELALEQR
ncbi:D-alanine--D-alanine ligase family protein [Acidovorax sacchari]|uniref:D-alanine--D-alanine ligase family protein n=1 Tax=Acidovorax sacchari TaxID=3230736 RepID=UPI0039E659C3